MGPTSGATPGGTPGNGPITADWSTFLAKSLLPAVAPPHRPYAPLPIHPSARATPVPPRPPNTLTVPLQACMGNEDVKLLSEWT
mmetsp:Transcript_1042/g.2205  ORF Transcript_1042/g.2205 Transcript_1042/m.2205 type:complete len:84 (+) Transcript_1042:201-452(+)